MNSPGLRDLVDFLDRINPGESKEQITKKVVERFQLTRDRSVYFCNNFAIRFSTAKSTAFSNTVLSISALQKYDNRPLVVVLCTPNSILCLLANSTLLKKVSHSSQDLRINNIRGSFNGTDIIRELSGIENNKSNLERLFAIHSEIGFDENLPRLVEATNSISPTGNRFEPTKVEIFNILESPVRARNFVNSPHFHELKSELDKRVNEVKNEILLAGLIESQNLRGRAIEYLIAGENEELRQQLIEALHESKNQLPPFKTGNTLGDYEHIFPTYETATDVKTKIMILNSNPKAYNIDKMLDFLAKDSRVFMFYFVGIEPMRIVDTLLISAFQQDLLNSTVVLKHWAGRKSRGATQFEGTTVKRLIIEPNHEIQTSRAQEFLQELIDIP